MAPRNPTMFNANRLKLGIFAANCSSGTAVTTVPERWDASWENNLALARMADDAGFEFMLPIARWRGYGGETNFEGETLETITWASGLLAGAQGVQHLELEMGQLRDRHCSLLPPDITWYKTA